MRASKPRCAHHKKEGGKGIWCCRSPVQGQIGPVNHELIRRLTLPILEWRVDACCRKFQLNVKLTIPIFLSHVKLTPSNRRSMSFYQSRVSLVSSIHPISICHLINLKFSAGASPYLGLPKRLQLRLHLSRSESESEFKSNRNSGTSSFSKWGC